MSEQPQTWSYEGPAYVRPVSRGVIMGEPGTDTAPYIDDVIEELNGGDGDCRVRIEVTVWRLPYEQGGTLRPTPTEDKA